MGDLTESKISCSHCGENLDPDWAHFTPRPPCPACGRTGVTIQVSIVGEVNIASSLTVGMRPHDTERNWRRRWTQLQADWEALRAPITETMSGDAINRAHHRLQSFFVQAYHLKDALIADSTNGLTANEIEAAITADVSLSLLADLANLDKHGRLNRPPRSGEIPKIGPATGHEPGAGSGWRLEVEIAHEPRIRDGLGVAGASMAAWASHLKRWRLI